MHWESVPVETVHIGLRYPHDILRQEEVDNIAAIIKLNIWASRRIDSLNVTPLHSKDGPLRVDIVLLVAKRDLHDLADRGIRRAGKETLKLMPRRFASLETGPKTARLLLAA